jgi:hypothetical protein
MMKMECEHLIYLNREGSQLAISLFCDIVLGVHPVEAFLSARLDVIPRKGFKK